MDREETSIEAQKEKYLAEKRENALIVGAREFVTLSQMYLSRVTLAGAASFRLKDGKEGILINYDHYQTGLGEDFTDCIDHEIEHEAWELWLTRGKNKIDSFGPDHYEAIRKALEMAHRKGKFDRYLTFKRKQMKTFDAMGNAHALEELDFYNKYAQELRQQEGDRT